MDGVIIVGGGLGGSTTALALRRIGMAVDVYERARAFQVVGGGLTIPQGVRKAVKYLGISDAFEQAVETPERPPLLDWKTGAVLAEPEPRTPHLDEVRRIRRSDFRDLLTEALRSVGGCMVHFGHRLVAVRQDDVGATAVFENGEAIDGDLLIGADGIRSAVRQYLAASAAPTPCRRPPAFRVSFLGARERGAPHLDRRSWTNDFSLTTRSRRPFDRGPDCIDCRPG